MLIKKAQTIAKGIVAEISFKNSQELEQAKMFIEYSTAILDKERPNLQTSKDIMDKAKTLSSTIREKITYVDSEIAEVNLNNTNEQYINLKNSFTSAQNKSENTLSIISKALISKDNLKREREYAKHIIRVAKLSNNPISSERKKEIIAHTLPLIKIHNEKIYAIEQNMNSIVADSVTANNELIAVSNNFSVIGLANVDIYAAILAAYENDREANNNLSDAATYLDFVTHDEHDRLQKEIDRTENIILVSNAEITTLLKILSDHYDKIYRARVKKINAILDAYHETGLLPKEAEAAYLQDAKNLSEAENNTYYIETIKPAIEDVQNRLVGEISDHSDALEVLNTLETVTVPKAAAAKLVAAGKADATLINLNYTTEHIKNNVSILIAMTEHTRKLYEEASTAAYLVSAEERKIAKEEAGTVAYNKALDKSGSEQFARDARDNALENYIHPKDIIVNDTKNINSIMDDILELHTINEYIWPTYSGYIGYNLDLRDISCFIYTSF